MQMPTNSLNKNIAQAGKSSTGMQTAMIVPNTDDTTMRQTRTGSFKVLQVRVARQELISKLSSTTYSM